MKTYLVGGAIRDELMGITPKDKDYVVVGSTPEEMLAAGFEQVGADFPVFLHPVTREEYALARTERKNGVGYHGFDVTFDKSITLRDDLERRDLTINSMARGGDQLFDPFGGMEDLNNKVLKHTSIAFRDDPLRVIRLARFAARFPDFAVHHATMALAQRMVEDGDLDHLPPERFAAEIVKVLEANEPATRFFTLLTELGVQNHVYFFKGLNMHRLLNVAREAQKEYKPAGRAEAFAALAYAGDVVTVKIGGASAQSMRNLLLQNQRASARPTKGERLEKLCSRIGYQSLTNLYHYLTLVRSSERLGIVLEFDAVLLNQAWHLLQPVSSALGSTMIAGGHSGAAIGKAIALARLRLVNVLIGE